jgi:uncharacterized protein RhaS with RHS repeats
MAAATLVGVTDSYGRTLTFTSANGILQTMTDPDGRTYVYGYSLGLASTPDRLSQVTYPDGAAVQYVYEGCAFPLFADRRHRRERQPHRHLGL